MWRTDRFVKTYVSNYVQFQSKRLVVFTASRPRKPPYERTIDQRSEKRSYLPIWLVARGFSKEAAMLIGLLVALRCLGTGDPTVGVEDSDDKPESRPSSPFRLDASPFSSSTFALALATRGLPVKTVRFFAPFDDSDVDDAIALDYQLRATVRILVSHRSRFSNYFLLFYRDGTSGRISERFIGFRNLAGFNLKGI